MLVAEITMTTLLFTWKDDFIEWHRDTTDHEPRHGFVESFEAI